MSQKVYPERPFDFRLSKSTNVDCFSNSINKPRFALLKYIRYNFYCCVLTIFDEVLIFKKIKKIFVIVCFFWWKKLPIFSASKCFTCSVGQNFLTFFFLFYEKYINWLEHEDSIFNRFWSCKEGGRKFENKSYFSSMEFSWIAFDNCEQ